MDPLVPIFDGYHAAVLGGTTPDWGSLAGTALESATLLAISVVVFVRASRSFVEEL
jgi:ABC-type polysaccharide/polyol phosphate export permease